MDDFSSSDIIIQPHFENIDSFYFVKFNYQKESSPATNSFHFENQILSNKMNHETHNNNNNTNSRRTPSITIENKRTTESTYKNGQTNKQFSPKNNNFIHNTIEQLVQKVFNNENAKPSNLETVAEQSPHNSNPINENKQNGKFIIEDNTSSKMRLYENNISNKQIVQIPKQDKIQCKEVNSNTNKLEIKQSNNQSHDENVDGFNNSCNNKALFVKQIDKGGCWKFKKMLCCFSSSND
jgi:hypothetical protein